MPQHGPRPLPLFLSLLRQQTADDPARRAAALAGLRRYQDAVRLPRSDDVAVHATAGRARLLDYGGLPGAPVAVFVPSLINPPWILDLAADTSLLRWLATAGVRPMLVDWGAPDPATDREQGLAGHVEELLLPLLATLAQPPRLVGYCLGGVLALAAATLRPVSGVALLATPWRFGGYPGDAATALRRTLAAAQPVIDALGVVPLELLQPMFWHIDAARTVAKFERFATLAADGAPARAFVALEDWANAGVPLTPAAASDLQALFADDPTGRGDWRVGDRAVDPARLGCPLVEFVSLTDRIAPAATAIGLDDGRRLTLGHVGMIVGGRARGAVWEPLAQWLRNPGSTPDVS